MTAAFKSTLAALAIFPLISGCVTPQTKQVESLSPENKLFSDVQFTLIEQFKEKEIKCIAVGNFQITDENAGYPEPPKRTPSSSVDNWQFDFKKLQGTLAGRI